MSKKLLGIGNPLLDISAVVPMDVLNKYGVSLNSACLAEEKHLPLYKELVDNYSVSYIAGGATQNSIRVAQWLLPADSTHYTGGVGKDAFGKQLRQSAEADGVAVHYMEVEDQPTGTCAVLIHDKERSLVANLAAANHFKPTHLETDAVKALLPTIDVIYSAGFFLTASPESLMKLAEFAAANNKVLAGNISAPFIAQFFTDRLMAAVPYYDYLFGNESEAEALGQKLGLADVSVEAVALHLAKLDKVNKGRERVVVITQGSKQTVVASASLGVQSFAVPPLDQSLIVDLNGAGDAFVGGFLSQLLQDKELRTCVEAGHYAARHIIQVSGTELKGKADFQPSA